MSNQLKEILLQGHNYEYRGCAFSFEEEDRGTEGMVKVLSIVGADNWHHSRLIRIPAEMTPKGEGDIEWVEKYFDDQIFST